ncbi:MAG: hydroxymethylglutaryl-CoA synthase [Nitrososphaerota archaeon]|nr:hydroxymethylglutaryl-CoA synthase [Candidatus Bathyarchaeota archaeon]MDW8022726.1 hydroxymethylglutaryl-CoA synthase [Nitrososphaerota archaeon]
MAGITSYGAYIPIWRMNRELLGKGLSGERSVAGSDEDSLTMAVAASIDCINGIDRETIDGVFFASTTSPFKEKCVATTIATVLDLRHDVFTADFANSLRAGTSALKAATSMVKAGAARQILVVAADCRLGAPESSFEQTFGDGAAALLVGKENLVADLEDDYSISDEIYDVWRRDVDVYVNAWEDRFINTYGYSRVVGEAVSGLMKQAGITPKEITKAIFSSPDARRSSDLARSLGFEPKTQVQDPLINNVGNTGTAQPLMLFVAALEEAKPDDRFLLASYGNGSDAFLFRVKEGIKSIGDKKRGVKMRLKVKKPVPDYATYLKWRKLVRLQAPRVPMSVSYPTSTAIWRERRRIFALHGVKCRVCGTVQYPPQRVCMECRSKDNFEEVRLYERKGKLFTYSFEFIRGNVPIGLINLEGGGRLFIELTDVDPEELKIDLPVELTFRRLNIWRPDGMYIYFWKATPIRF